MRDQIEAHGQELGHYVYGPEHTPVVRFFVSVDGGDARANSQIRRLVLQCALALGYKGISDLHDQTKIDIKDKIKAAAFCESSWVHVIEPRTFSDKFTETYSKVARIPQRIVFCMVNTPENVNKKQGDSRAWYNFAKKPPPACDYIELNNPKPGCESKAPSTGLEWGRNRSQDARSFYVDHANELKFSPLVITLNNNSYIDLSEDKVKYDINPDITIGYGRMETPFRVWTGGNKVKKHHKFKVPKFDPNS